MERHRTDPVCASCHVRMDPLGFALESFDAVGGYRSLSVEDTSGTLPDGTELDGPSSVREMLLRNREDFVGTVTEKLMTYALGPRGRVLRPPVHPTHRDRGRGGRLSLVVADSRYRRQRAVPDEEGPRLMIITKTHVPRRTFLRGVGATLALPLLDGMVPAFTPLRLSAAAPVRRLGLVYVPNGIVMDQWTPDETGTGFAMKPVMQSMEPYRNQLTVVSGLANKHGDALPGEGAGDHARAAGAFLTGVHPKKTAGADIRAGISMDQIAARELAQETQLASLELSLDSKEPLGACDPGYSCVYANTLNWLSETTPLPMENNPRVVFERLFGGSGTTDAAARRARMEEDGTILDAVGDKIARLQGRLGGRDRLKMDEYLEAIRDVERRIRLAEQQGLTDLSVALEQPPGIPATFEAHAKLMYDLQVLAYQADLTRIITFMVAHETSNRAYPEIDVSDAHHPLSHHGGDEEKIAS